MPLVCTQCALEAFVEGRPASDGISNDEPAEHMKKHAGLTPEKRQEWERRAAEKMAREQGNPPRTEGENS